MSRRRAAVAATLAALLLAACADKAGDSAKKAPPTTLITTTQARIVSLEVVESTLGTLESVFDPKVAAEIPGRVTRVLGRAGRSVKKGELLAEIEPADLLLEQQAEAAEVRRLESLVAQQDRLLARQTELQQKNFISRNALDDVAAQRDALAQQLAAARARLRLGDNAVGKARVGAPYDGEIVVQIVAPGDYVKVGDPLFQFVSNRRMRANLPFPEAAAARIRPGQAVRLSTPQSGQVIEGVIEDIRPTLLAGSRAIEAIARFDNTTALLSGGSLDAQVIVARKDNAIVVPEQSVVLRPAGKAVFAIVDGKAAQRVVDTGSKQGGMIEITRGLAAGTTIALDGAGFLSDGAAVTVKELPKAPAAAGGTPEKPKPAG